MTRYAKWSRRAFVAGCLLAAMPTRSIGAEGLRIALTDAGGAAAPGVVVYLQGSVAESARKGVPHAVVDQRNKAYVPGYIVVQKLSLIHI